MSFESFDVVHELLAVGDTRRHARLEGVAGHDLNAYVCLILVEEILKLRHVIKACLPNRHPEHRDIIIIGTHTPSYCCLVFKCNSYTPESLDLGRDTAMHADDHPEAP